MIDLESDATVAVRAAACNASTLLLAPFNGRISSADLYDGIVEAKPRDAAT
ncbi:hypothetical protein APY04_0221 [Hyphomicrobium sulfonivorans]|uniref:Uncharacterized protein n=1 Tax=Hyphomicrobium sulfonivorans TaxID=121290 RepID=A0A120CY38_HYPSL|nr:hypothetical protein APY04_0221 [Hyphomicrobium sulfonivorans]